MSGEARALANVLLDHHRRICRPRRLTSNAVTPDAVYQSTITYGDLCARAGVPYLTRAVARFLAEIADWCNANGWPPLNSLAVNAQTRVPGEGYDGAGGEFAAICCGLKK
jgi:hypothetical protein